MGSQEARIKKERVASTKKRIIWVIDDYKAPSTFEIEVIEGSTKEHHLGFANCKEVVFMCFPDLNLIDIEVLASKENAAALEASCLSPLSIDIFFLATSRLL